MLSRSNKIFSLYLWLLKKLYNKLFIWYFFTFISLFFYYQSTNYGLKQLWGYEKAKLPFRIFVWEIGSRAGLIWYLIFAFFFFYLLISVVCEYLKNYSLELCRFQLRKLILVRSQKNPEKVKENQKEILNNFFAEVELFAPIFTLVPHRIFNAIVSIFLNLYFLSDLQNDDNNFTSYFILILAPVLAALIFFCYRIQTKINKKENQSRRQENGLFDEYFQKPKNLQKLEKVIDDNFAQTRHSLSKKAFSALSYLIIPGLGILFCFAFSAYYGKNFEIKEFVKVGTIANSLQTVFFKIKDMVDSLSEVSKGEIYYQTLAKTLKKLEKNNSRED